MRTLREVYSPRNACGDSPQAFPTAFLGDGEWTAEIFEDAPDADINAEHYVRRTMRIKAGDPLMASLAHGGGFAAKFTPKQK